MADQGRWFKLWVGARRDPDLAALSKEDYANWCILGTYLKENGTDGFTSLAAPAIALQRAMEIDGYEALVTVLKKLPNCTIYEEQNSLVTNVTILTVTWKNWRKYQGDFSSDRVDKFRARETAKKRREEKRREESVYVTQKRAPFTKPKPEEITAYATAIDFVLNGQTFWDHYEARGWQYRRGQPMKDWKAAVRTWKKNDFNVKFSAAGGVGVKPEWQ